MEVDGDGDGDKDKGYDVVTRIQNEVANLSSMYYNFTGGLQEMAPPVSRPRREILKPGRLANDPRTFSASMTANRALRRGSCLDASSVAV